MNEPKSIQIISNDTIPAFGAWLPGESTMLLNVAYCMLPCVDEDGNEVIHTAEEKKWLMITTMMHEFGHALQEYFDLEFTEERIDAITEAYEKHYLTPETKAEPKK